MSGENSTKAPMKIPAITIKIEFPEGTSPRYHAPERGEAIAEIPPAHGWCKKCHAPCLLTHGECGGCGSSDVLSGVEGYEKLRYEYDQLTLANDELRATLDAVCKENQRIREEYRNGYPAEFERVNQEYAVLKAAAQPFADLGARVIADHLYGDVSDAWPVRVVPDGMIGASPRLSDCLRLLKILGSKSLQEFSRDDSRLDAGGDAGDAKPQHVSADPVVPVVGQSS